MAQTSTDMTCEEWRTSGYRPDVDRLATVRWLAAGFVMISLGGLTPAILELTRTAQLEPIPRWGYLLIFSTAVQFAYVVYLVQFPDWSSTWVVTLLATLLATAYALLLGLALLAPASSVLVELLELDGHRSDHRVAGWCFIMVCTTSLWSYCAGKFCIGWRERVGKASGG